VGDNVKIRPTTGSRLHLDRTITQRLMHRQHLPMQLHQCPNHQDHAQLGRYVSVSAEMVIFKHIDEQHNISGNDKFENKFTE